MDERWPPGSSAPNRRVLLAVVACVLVTTAAGSGTGVALSAVAGDDPLDTPATAAAEVQNQSFPPGTNESGVTNATALLDAHDSALGNTTYTERLRAGERPRSQAPTSADPTIGPFNVTTRNGSAGTNTTIAARGSHSEYWTTDGASAEYSTNTDGNVTSKFYVYEEGNVFGLEAGSSAAAQIQREALSTYVRGANYSYGGTVTRGNDTLYKFSSTGGDVSNLTANGRSSSVRSVGAALLVSERGVVREMSAAVEYTTQNETKKTHTNYSVTDIGETTTREPAWVTEQLPQFDVRVTDDSRVVALEYAGGGATSNGTLPTETGVFVFGNRSDAATQLDATLAPGDTLYLWNESGTAGLQRSVNDAPTVTDSFASLGGTAASYLVSRFVLVSESRGTTPADTAIEVYVDNESVGMNRSAANGNATRDS